MTAGIFLIFTGASTSENRRYHMLVGVVAGLGIHFSLRLVSFSRGAFVAAGTVSITLDGSEEELRSLANWLRDEDDLRGRVRLKEKPIEEGAMGGVFDSIVLVLGSAGTVTALTSVKDWLVARKSAQKITMKLKAETGRELELSCGSAKELVAAVEHARNFFSESA